MILFGHVGFIITLPLAPRCRNSFRASIRARKLAIVERPSNEQFCIASDGIDVSCSLPDEIPVLTADAATALYRITQEALRNSIKHAPGAPVHVTLGTQDNSVQLTIRDDGPGFELTKVRLAGGLGILNMNERARLVKGALLLDSRPGDGTVITVRVPAEVSK